MSGERRFPPAMRCRPDGSAGLFHRLNNQLGVILANAELLEARLTDETQRARASLVVSERARSDHHDPGSPPHRRAGSAKPDRRRFSRSTLVRNADVGQMTDLYDVVNYPTPLCPSAALHYTAPSQFDAI